MKKLAVSLFVIVAGTLMVRADYRYKYYWTGAAGGGNLIQNPANWNDANGNPWTKYYQSNGAVYFDNTESLSLTASEQLYFDGYYFRGSGDVTIPARGSKCAINMRKASGSGGIYYTGTGTAYFDYTVNFPADLGDYPIETAEGATVYLSSYGTTTINTGVRVIKRGPGTLQTGKNVWNGTGRLEGGTWYCEQDGSTFGSANRLEVAGPDVKALSFKNPVAAAFASYFEEEDAGTNMTFQIYTGSDATLTFRGAAGTTTRFSADVKNVAAGTYQLVWDPQCAATMDVVRRNYNRSATKFLAKSGTMRLADGVGITKLREVRVANGGTLEIAADATDVSYGAPMVVEEGGTLVVGRTYTPCNNLTWNGTVKLTAGRFYNPYDPSHQSAATIGATADLVVDGPDAKDFYCYGNKNTAIRDYTETASAEQAMSFFVFTSSHPTFTIRGTKDTRFTANVGDDTSGSYTIVWNPSDASKVMTLAKRTWTSSKGRFTAASGTIRLAEGAGYSGGTFTVAAGAKVAFAADVGNVKKMPLVLADGAKVVLEDGVVVQLNSLTRNDETITEGFFSEDSCDWIEGDGYLVVGDGKPAEPETTEAIWTGGAGADDTAIDSAANWGGTLPDLTTGSLVATFPAGAKVSVPAASAYVLKGLVAQGALDLSGAALTLGSEGLVAAAGAAVTNRCPIAFRQQSTVSAGAGGEVVFTETAVLSSLLPRGLWPLLPVRMEGDGAIRIYSSNPDLGDVTATAEVYLYADNAVGGAGATATSTKTVLSQDRAFHLFGNTFDNDFIGDEHSHGTSYVLFDVHHGRNVFNGCVTGTSGNSMWWHFDNGDTQSEVVFAGGYAYGGSNMGALFTPIHNGTMTVENVPMNVTKIMMGYAWSYDGVLSLNVASNVTTRGLVLVKSSVLNTTVKDALYAADDGASGVILNMSTTWNLGADQGVNLLASPLGSAASIVSETGATLSMRDDRLNTLNQNEEEYWSAFDTSWLGSFKAESAKTNAAAFKGDVNFVKLGQLDHFLTGTSTSIGTLTVGGGRLIFSNGGSWKTCTGLTVENGAKVVVDGNSVNPFGSKMPIAVAGDSTDGTFVIPTGVKMRCGSLAVNGTPVPDGDYTDGLVTGGGTLRVGTVGTMLLIR